MEATENRRQAPDVSVVVIVYNDEDRLPTAVRSVLGQTLRSVEAVIVDDCSTDGSYDVARGLADAHPDRVRAVRLPYNSGGCGAPRNRGIAETRGQYVMFLDSDDELERNACRNLLEAAEDTGADLVSGMCVRVHLGGRHRRTSLWYPWLYSATRTLESVSELPDLFVYDTLATNKCYRRDFLLERNLLFPVGIHYEDLLFSAQAYLAARRITLVPNRVYFWNVATGTGAQSISNRRHEIANFAHRMEIHRRIDELLERRRLEELKFRKDVKFLKHDLVLHLRDLPLLDEEYRHRFAELANAYLAGIGPAAHGEVQPLQAICAYLLAREDWDNLLPASDTLANRDKISSPLAERDGRIYWCAEHLDDPEGRRVLDVTDLGLHTRPLGTMFLRNRLTGYADDGRGTVRLSGRIVNPLGRIPLPAGAGREDASREDAGREDANRQDAGRDGDAGPGSARRAGTRPDHAGRARIRGHLEFRARRRSAQTFRFPLASLRHTGDHLEWTAQADLGRRLRPLGVIDAVWDVRLILDVDGTRLRTRLSTGGLALDEARPLRVRPRLTRLVADRLVAETSRRGHLSFVLAARGPAAVRTRQAVGRAVAGRPGDLALAGVHTVRRLRRRITSGDTKVRVYHAVLCRLPVRRGLVVFESHLGRQYSDNPRAIYEELRRRGAAAGAVWSYAGSRPDGFPADATLVRRWSWAYLHALARAEFWIDNQGFPLKLTKRPDTTYIQTWHGSALKRMGFDEPGHKAMNRRAREDYGRALDRFDHFLVRSEHDVRTLARAFRLREEVPLRTGYPRNDALVAARRTAEGISPPPGGGSATRERGPLAAELGIPADRQILLYAPTFREAPGGRVLGFEPALDAEEFARRFGERYTLLIRAHYLGRVVLPPSVRGTVLDVTAHHDITPLLALADALVTDYSSVMFDYALLDRPMIFYAYDWDAYVLQARGAYFDLREKAPGPVVGTQEELFTALADLKAADRDYADARRRFAAEFGEYDRGDAARSIVDTFFTPGSPG